MSELQRHLQTLELTPGAAWDDVTRAYRDLIKIWHPDRFAHDEQLRERAEAKSKQLNEAIRQLRRHYRKTSLFRRNDLDDAIRRGSAVSRSPVWAGFSRTTSSRNSTTGTHRQFPGAGTNPTYAALEKRKRSARLTRVFGGAAVISMVVLLVIVVGLPQGITALFRSSSTPLPQMRSLNDYRVVSTAEPYREAEETEAMKVWSPVEKPLLIENAANCNVKALAELLRRGEDIDAADPNGDTALAWAARTNCYSGAKLLIERGANPRTVARNGFTPKDWAKWAKNQRVIALLER